MQQHKIIFITGATSGFGEAIAHKFAEAHYACILAGRRADRLKKVADCLTTKYQVPVLTIQLDVQNRKQVFEAVENLPTEWKNIDVLVNNAGLALGREPFDVANLDDWEKMIDTNVKGLLYISKAVIPIMIQQQHGLIINMGSIAGKEVYKDGNIYCATKFAVDAISKAQRIDLLPHGIKVVVIHPGAADTEFSTVRFKGNSEKASSVYEGYTPLTASDIADAAFYCSELPPHVCINELVITPTAQANSFYLHKS